MSTPVASAADPAAGAPVSRDFPQFYEGDLVYEQARPHTLGVVEYTAWDSGAPEDDGDFGDDDGNYNGDAAGDSITVVDNATNPTRTLSSSGGNRDGDGVDAVDGDGFEGEEDEDGYEDEDEDEDEEPEVPLNEGEAAVYINGEVSPFHHSRLRLVDRAMRPGGPVAWATRPVSSFGIVTNAKVYCDLVFEFPVKKKTAKTRGPPPKRFIVLPCVPSWILQRVHLWGRPNVFVATDDHAKVGTALGGSAHVTVKFGPKLVVDIASPEFDEVDPVQRESGLEPEDPDMFYYPGLVVDVTRAALLQKGTWLEGNAAAAAKMFKGQPALRGTVTQVTTKSVEMQWVAVLKQDADLDQDATISPARLVDIDPFDHVYMTMNDRVYLPARLRKRFAKLYCGDSVSEWVKAVADFEGVEYPYDPRSVKNTDTKTLFGDDAEADDDAADGDAAGADGEEDDEDGAADGKKAAAATAAEPEADADADADSATAAAAEPEADAEAAETETAAAAKKPAKKTALGTKKTGAAGKKAAATAAAAAPTKTPEQLNTCWRLGIARVFKTRTVADVLWQDGTISREVPAVDLIPRDQLQDFDHCAMDFIESRAEVIRGGARCALTGYVVKMDAPEQTAYVRWIRQYKDAPAPPRSGNKSTNNNSILDHSSGSASTAVGAVGSDEAENAHSAWAGGAAQALADWRAGIEAKAAAEGKAVRDVTFGSNNNAPSTEPPAMEVDVDAYEITVTDGVTYVTTPVQEVSVYDIRTATQEVNIGDFVVRLMPVTETCSHKEWSGCIVAIEHGFLLVKWSQGTFSRVWPWEIYVISNEDADNNEDNLNNQIAQQAGTHGLAVNASAADGKIYINANASANKDGASADANADAASSSSSVSGAAAAAAEPAAAAAATEAPAADAAKAEPAAAGAAATSPVEETVEISTEPVPADAVFGGFETTEAPAPRTAFPAALMSPALSKRVRTEWRQLASSCPPGVHIYGYETSIDTLTVLIAGPAGTPYAHGVYEFHVVLPTDYPNSAPKVVFSSYGTRIHPNLYDTGRVCLSLLGTWDGHGTQNWNAQHSNLLQLIVSLQGLVIGLNEPYYNEAGYDKLRGTRQAAAASIAYNEQAMLLSMSMLAKTLSATPARIRSAVVAHARAVAEPLRRLIALEVPPLAHATVAASEAGAVDKALSADEIAARQAALTPAQRHAVETLALWGLPPQLDVGVGAFAKAEELSGKMYYPTRGFVLQFAQVRARLDAALKMHGL